MKLVNIVKEMAMPSAAQRSAVYYHGTSTKEAGDKIIASKQIIPRAFINKYQDIDKKLAQKGTSARHFQPRIDRIYITPVIQTAAIYALGGDLAGTDYFEPGNYGEKEAQKEQYGYLAVIPGSELKDVEPDEDELGEIVAKINDKIFKKEKLTYLEDWLYKFAKSIIHPTTFRKMVHGETEYQAHAGKQMLRKMDEYYKERIMKEFSPMNLSNKGPLTVRAVWRFPKIKCAQLEKDASNFFKLAERIF